MFQPGFSEHENTLALERQGKYIGRAKVNLDELCFVPALPDGTDSRKVRRLQEIFKNGQCARFDIRNHIPAVVSQESIEISLAISHVTRAELLNASPNKFPHLKFSSGQVLVLHGRHRIQAASRALFPDDRWWTVDLYLDGILSARHMMLSCTNTRRHWGEPTEYTPRRVRQRIVAYRWSNLSKDSTI